LKQEVATVTNQVESRPAPPNAADDIPQRALRTAAADLKMAQGSKATGTLFTQWRAALQSSPPETASATIRELLDTREDAPSQLEFAVGPDGFLTQPSSLRVFLLDELAKIDPSGAASYAEKILASKDSPDEWAVSLRNYALGQTNAGARLFLQEKVRELMRDEGWQRNPTIGFLEAFDVAVFVGGTELIPDLAKLVQGQDNQAVAHAAYLALDRLTIQDPAAVLTQLQNQPELMLGRETTRANYFARANLADPQQKLILENYLLDPGRATAELDSFAGLFPSANFMISHNLLTHTATPTREALAAQDRQALRVIVGWMADPRFEPLKPQLQEINKRLSGFVWQPE
jgi:hypothetical protein